MISWLQDNLLTAKWHWCLATLLLRYIGIQEYKQNTTSWVKSPIPKRHVESELAHWCRLNQTDCNVLAISCVYRLENNYFAKHSDLYGLVTDCLLTGNTLPGWGCCTVKFWGHCNYIQSVTKCKKKLIQSLYDSIFTLVSHEEVGVFTGHWWGLGT